MPNRGRPAHRSKALTHGLAALLASGAAGCSGDGSAPSIGLPPAASLTPVQSVSTATGHTSTGRPVVGTPTEVYTRIARGALTCWFGASGPLKSTHIYHAEAEPASKGGNAEIVLFQRDETLEDPRSIRAFKVAIGTAEARTRVDVENFKFSEQMAARLSADVDRWASDEGGCGDAPVTGGWAAAEPSPSHDGKAAATAKPANHAPRPR